MNIVLTAVNIINLKILKQSHNKTFIISLILDNFWLQNNTAQKNI